MNRFRLVSVAGLAASLAACGSTAPAPGFHAALPPPPPVAPARDGAIFQAANGYAAYHEGTRARAVGDVLTIVLTESVVTAKSTAGSTNRNGSASITPPSAGPLDFLDPEALKAAAQASFNGKGDAAQRSTLSGAIAVTIAEVRPNRTALVLGEKKMLLSQGDEWVQFAGIVRLADIDIENRVRSTSVADAQIIYSGNGAVQQASRPGWLSRFFGAISPF
ncbi:flagellar basal body L-ring protein FlgH [Erythrobacter sp. LQ02-29]|nr:MULTISPECIES: flagellar basal body L-ring protein FlgH [unclassified Erythrobacter]MCP9221224.1 flagellar basal body L-ring protein FlgH [Erythrobacter sp. LQ02-29]QWC58402.1 flagellar biosynthesis protein FlgH [Erythrobacter sp. 3-20A1M]